MQLANRPLPPLGFLWRVSLVVMAGLWLVACGDSSSPTDPGAGISSSEVTHQLLQLLTGERQQAGVEPPLEQDPNLTELARRHSEAMRDQGFFGHVDPQRGGLEQRLRTAGIDFRRAAENLAQVTNGSAPAATAHAALMTSAQHRENILDPGFRRVGIGVARSTDTFWVTQIFIARR